MRRYPSVNWVCSEATYKMGRDSENNMFMKYYFLANNNFKKHDYPVGGLVSLRWLLLGDAFFLILTKFSLIKSSQFLVRKRAGARTGRSWCHVVVKAWFSSLG